MNSNQEAWVTRQTLLNRAKDQNDQQAWEDFIQYYESFLTIILKHLKIQPSDLQDVTQEVLIKLWKSLQNFEYQPQQARFRTWLNRIIRNAVIDFYRKKKRIHSKETHSLDDESNPLNETQLESGSDDLESFIEHEWKVHISNLAMERVKLSFSGKAIKVFELSLDGKDPQQVAKELDLATSSIYKLRKRVEQRLVLEIQNLKAELEF